MSSTATSGPNDSTISAANHPRPQLRRAGWLRLDGRWDFALDPQAAFETPSDVKWNRSIEVPFAPEEAGRSGLVIDAVFGAGFRGELPPLVADTLRAASHVLAVDVPSGLDGGTGQPRGDVRAADLTVTFARLKPGQPVEIKIDAYGRTWKGHLTNLAGSAGANNGKTAQQISIRRSESAT